MISQENVSNALLQTFPKEAFAKLAPHFEPIDIPKGSVIFEPNERPPFCVFFESGLGSVLAESPSGGSIEIGLYGVEGFGGIPVILAAGHSPHRLVMQIGGSGFRVPTSILQQALDNDTNAADLMRRYVQYFLIQVGQTCLSNALHTIEVRLARWLLMGHDRMPGDEVPLTQEYLSLMLGCTRTTVTSTISLLTEQGVLGTTRGKIQVRNRSLLEGIAGEAYGIPEAEFDRLVAPFFGNGASKKTVRTNLG